MTVSLRDSKKINCKTKWQNKKDGCMYSVKKFPAYNLDIMKQESHRKYCDKKFLKFEGI